MRRGALLLAVWAGLVLLPAGPAAALAMAGQRVLAVDLDPQANLTSGVGLKGQTAPGGTVYHALTAEVDDSRPFILQTSVPGLSLVPADRNLTGAEVELVTLPEREARMRTLLAGLRDGFDFIFIDTPPSLGLLTLSGTTGGDAALSGNLSFAAVSAVPEPATWAFMLVGFGAVGYSMRKRPAYKVSMKTAQAV